MAKMTYKRMVQMRNSIFGQALWGRKVSVIVTAGGLGLFAMLFAALHESFASDITDFADALPAGMTAIFGDLAAAATPAGFLNVELYSLFLPFAVAITGIVFGAKAIGKEEEDGTLELLLASPISRYAIAAHKLLAIYCALAIVAFSAYVGVLIGTVLFTFPVAMADVALASLSVFLCGLVYAAVAFCGQAVTGKVRWGVGLGAGALVVTYAAYVLAGLIDGLENIQYLSPFYYMDVAAVLQGDGQVWHFIVLAVVSIMVNIVGSVAFSRRDTGV